MEYQTAWILLRTLRCQLFGKTDLSRWRDETSYDDWEERTRLIATLLPEQARIIEFGAGRRLLERYLKPGQDYTPADLSDRGSGTIVFDLNERPLPDLRSHRFDVAVLAGVLEYVADPASFVRWLSTQTEMCILSYGLATATGPIGRFKEQFVRTSNGWVNSLHESALLALFRDAGFEPAGRALWETPEGNETIYRFSKRDPRPRR